MFNWGLLVSLVAGRLWAAPITCYWRSHGSGVLCSVQACWPSPPISLWVHLLTWLARMFSQTYRIRHCLLSTAGANVFACWIQRSARRIHSPLRDVAETTARGKEIGQEVQSNRCLVGPGW